MYRCSHGAQDRLSLVKHKMQMHPGEPRVGSRCRFCDQCFLQASTRDQHQLRTHSERQLAFFRCPVCQLLTSSTVSHLFTLNILQKYIILYCFQIYLTVYICILQAVLNRHMRTSHPQYPIKQTGVRLKCRICLVLFSEMPEIRTHFRAIHPAAMVFRCRHCTAHLKTRKTLRHHVKVVHSEARRRDCNVCGKVLWSKRAYAIHYRMKHSKTSKVGFRCRICQQRFDTKEQRYFNGAKSPSYKNYKKPKRRLNSKTI
jgi:hypothetical protein